MPTQDWKNATRAPGKPRGILRHSPGPGNFHHARIAPVPALAGFVQHFWIVRWDLRGHAPQLRETLPHPNVHAVLGVDGAWLHGVHTGRFTNLLEGEGGVFGVKFRAGGFRPFLGRSVSSLRNRSLPLGTVFDDADALDAAVRAAAPDAAAMVEVAQRFLLVRLPPEDGQALLAGEIADAIAADHGIVRVEQVLERWRLSARSLQRLFNDHVGVGAKWVINRYRLHEAIERLAGGAPVDWAGLALELGYFDQAHFIRDFKAMTGRTPTEYVRIGAVPRYGRPE